MLLGTEPIRAKNTSGETLFDPHQVYPRSGFDEHRTIDRSGKHGRSVVRSAPGDSEQKTPIITEMLGWPPALSHLLLRVAEWDGKTMKVMASVPASVFKR